MIAKRKAATLKHDSSEAGEENLKILIGPTVALCAERRTKMSNQKFPGKEMGELTFAPAAAAIVFGNDIGEDIGVPLANAGYDPNESRIPAGQARGGQWTTAAADEIQKGRADVRRAKPVPSGRNNLGKKAAFLESLQTGPSFPITTGVEGLPEVDLALIPWPLYAGSGSVSERLPTGEIKVFRIPKNAAKFVSSSGQEFYAPETADFEAIHNLAKSKSRPTEYQAIGHYGSFDFQRNAGQGKQKDNHFYAAYTDASNYAVGVYTHGLGQSRSFTLLTGRLFASLHSSNAGEKRQESMWLKGWDDADAGSFAKPKPSAK